MSETPEQTNERDTQFKGFAELLFSQLNEMGLTALVDIHNFPNNPDRAYELQDEMNKLTKAIIARRAYDLVEHTITSENPIAHQSMSDDEIVASIPDMTEWPNSHNPRQ